ncbi:MAG: helix-hairpin-helix domain-containing protein [Gammaproteobacteria bacterium]|nr:helix-hairpin-helix domain-containing protein [Gammaproteobacteria bacterium]
MRRLARLLALVSMWWSGAALAAGVNVNTADARTLARELAGVGPAKAEAIVRYRKEHGPFRAPEDLKKVEGVGEAIYEVNKARIKVKD